MVWQQIVMGAVNTAEGYFDTRNKRHLAQAQYKLDSGRANRQDMLRKENNKLSIAIADLDRYQQDRANRKRLESMEKNLDIQDRNVASAMDRLASQRIDQRLEGAGTLGSIAAQAAAAGVGGSSIKMIQDAEELRQARIDQSMTEAEADSKYMAEMSKSALMDSTFSGLDQSYVLAGLDMTPKYLVMDTSKYLKWSLNQGAQDFMSGFSGNLNKVGGTIGGGQGVNLQQSGYKPEYNLFDIFKGGGSGGSNKGLFGGK